MRIQSFRHNPTIYVELVGNALFNPFVLEYAPMETRYRHIIQRLFKVPELMQQARMQAARFSGSVEPRGSGGERRKYRPDRQDPSGASAGGSESRLRSRGSIGLGRTTRLQQVLEGRPISPDQ